MKYILLSALLFIASIAFGQMSSAIDPIPPKPYKAKVKVKDDVARFKYKKTKLVLQCKFTEGRLDTILSVQSKKEELNRFDPSEKANVLELMKVTKNPGLDTYTRITDMYSDASEIEQQFKNDYKAYKAFIPNQYGRFSEGFALVKSGGKFGFIDRTGNIVFDFIFDNAANFKNGEAYVKVNEVWYLLQKDGQAKLLN